MLCNAIEELRYVALIRFSYWYRSYRREELERGGACSYRKVDGRVYPRQLKLRYRE
jgi:hypothetical protein